MAKHHLLNHLFILRMWPTGDRAGESNRQWRFSGEDVDTQTQYGFCGTQELLDFFERIVAHQRAPNGVPEEPLPSH